MSSLSSSSNDPSQYRRLSYVSFTTSHSLSPNSTNTRSSRVRYHRPTILSIPKVTTIPETLETSDRESAVFSNQTNDKSEMDLSVEEFQREALKEHNAMRTTYKKASLKLSESLNIYAQVRFRSICVSCLSLSSS